MARPTTLPITFGTKTVKGPLSDLDTDFTALLAGLKDSGNGYNNFGVVGGTPNAITLTNNPPCLSLSAGATFSFFQPAANVNTGAVNINVDGLGAVGVFAASSGAALVGGELRGCCTVVYDGAKFYLAAASGMYIFRTGDTMSAAAKFIFQTTNGVSGSTWATSPIHIQCTNPGGGGRAQISFENVSVNAVTLFLDTAANDLQFTDSGGVTHSIWDSANNNSLISGKILTISGQVQVPGSILVQNGGSSYIQNGGAFIAQSGATLTLQSGSQTYVQGSNGLQIIGTIANVLSVGSEVGLSSSSYTSAPMRIFTSGTSARPGLAFYHSGLGYGCFFYYGNDNRFHYIDAGGTDHVITSTP